MNVPKLRFNSYKENWEPKRLKDTCVFFKGKDISKADLSEEGEACILYGELYTKYGAVIDKVISKTSKKTDSLIKAQKQDVLIPSSGESAIDIACASSLMVESVLVGGDLNILRPNRDINGHFLSYQINGKRKKGLSTLAQGATVTHLYADAIKKLECFFPNLNEQEQIAQFIFTIEKKIKLYQEKIDLLKVQKKGFVQKIFSRELCFKDNNGQIFKEWQSHLLGSLGEFSTSYSYSRASEGNGCIQHIHYGDIHSILPTICEDVQFPTITEQREWEFVREGDILFADASEDYKDLGKAILIKSLQSEKTVAGLHTHKFIPNKSVDPLYLIYVTQTKEYREFIKKMGTGVSVLGISKTNLAKFNVPLPSLSEQKKIGEFLFSLDKKIQALSSKKELLIQQKQAFMQQMFI